MTTVAAQQACTLAWSYLEEAHDEFKTSVDLQQTASNALKRLSLAARQLEKAHVLDPAASIDTTDRHGDPYTPSQDELRAEMLRMEGISHQLLDKPKRAIAVLKKAVSYDPDNPEIHTRLADAYRALGRKTDALKSARVAVELDPDNLEYLKQVDEIENTSGAAANIAAFKGSWILLGIFLFVGITAVYIILAHSEFTTHLVGNAIVWLGLAFAYWRWRR